MSKTKSKPDKNKNNLRTWLIILISFSLAITMVVYVARHQQMVKAFIRSLGLAGPVAIIVLYAILGASPVPADPLTLINGAVFGPLLGGFIAWFGTTLAALIEYYIGTQIGDATDFEEKRKDLPLGLGEMAVDSVWFLLSGRMLTSAGSKAVSFLSGIYGVPLWRYTWTTAASTLFGALIFALGGFGLLQLF